MILRVQSAEGQSRVEAQATDPTIHLYELVHESLNLRSFAFALYCDRSKQQEVISSKSITLQDVGLKHGDMLYLSPVNGATIFNEQNDEEMADRADYLPDLRPSTSHSTPAPVPAVSQVPNGLPPASVLPEEDEVDLLLYKQDGKIQRQRDEKLCRHNANSSCVHCSPLDAWDESFLREHNIKHMPFHAYLRKHLRGGGGNSGTFVPLEEPNYEIKPGCREHPPWPRGLCSRCAPSAATLARQQWRHLDYVQFESRALVERFLEYWRATGDQRVALLYGTLHPHPDIPLGVRARVSFVYEPAQTGSRDAVALAAEDALAGARDALLAELGLRPVGWLFTDLLPLDLRAGTVHHLRGVESHFLSSWECILAGHLQGQHRNACRYAKGGYFGSKFATVCLTGDKDNQIHMEGYQVSAQCAALVREQLLLPTKDAPELFYVRDRSAQNYSFDVYYKEKDSYGNEVAVQSRRVPVAYVLVDVPVGVARDAAPAPAPAPAALFPPAHRAHPAHAQSLAALGAHVRAHASFLQAVSDVHVLLYLLTNAALPLPLDALRPLLQAVRAQDAEAAERWRAECGAWATLEALAEAAGAHDAAPPGGAGAAPGAMWTCAHCTFHNAAAAAACDMCALPRDNAM